MRSTSPSRNSISSTSSSTTSTSSIRSMATSLMRLKSRSSSTSSAPQYSHRKTYSTAPNPFVEALVPQTPPPAYSPYILTAEELEDDNLAWGKPTRKPNRR